MQEFKCPLCKNQYNEDNPPRLLIMCGHTFCHNCIKTNIRHHNLKYQISCPLDKLTINIDSNTPSHFPRNMAIIQLIAYYRNQKCQKASKGSTNSVILDQHCDFQVSGQKQQQYIQQQKSSQKFTFQNIDCELVDKNQQELCLLHRKPLDIICTQQKCTICAQCALFGMHKGHKFATMKQLLSKQHIFIKNANQLIKERTQIDHKIQNGQFQHQIGLILAKKKQLLLYQLSTIIKSLTSQIIKFQQTQQYKIQQHITKMQFKLKQQLKNSIQSNIKFNVWLTNNNKFINSQNKHIDHLIAISQSSNRSINQIEKGKNLVQNIKRQLMNYWNQLQKQIEYPKINVIEPISKYLDSNIKVRWSQQKLIQDNDVSQQQLKIWSQINVSEIYQNSLIDQKTCDFKHDIKMIQNQFTYEGSTRLSQIFKHFDQQILVQQKKPILRKVKSRDLTIHSTLFHPKDKANIFKSPKTKIKPQFSTTKAISSPMYKNSLKKYGLRVKDCQKFLRMVDGLQSNCLQVVDLTGYQLGDDIARQICIKILECNKVKMLKLMKNQLTDNCLKEVIDVLKIVDYVNLAQNAFTQKILQSLLIFASKNSFSKNKNVQLGQNQINSRRLKQKIQELKKYRITITL